MTEACKFLTPLPFLQQGDTGDDDDSSDSDNDENDESNFKNNNDLSAICDLSPNAIDYYSSCASRESLPPLFTTVNGRFGCSSSPNYGYEVTAAAIDIMELDSDDQSITTQLFRNGTKAPESIILMKNDNYMNQFHNLSPSNLIFNDIQRSINDLIRYLTAVFPTVLVSCSVDKDIKILSRYFLHS